MKVELKDWRQAHVPKLCLTSSDEDESFHAVAKLVKQDGEVFVAACEAGCVVKRPQSLDTALGAPRNPGSLGHPEMCRRPCVYLSAYGTTCPNGNSCGYCHLSHTERRTTLDKRQREFLRSLEEGQLISVLLPHLQAKLTLGKVPAAAIHVIQYLEARKDRSWHAEEPGSSRESGFGPGANELFLADQSLSLQERPRLC
ncbi:unnamed protein product [Durusdinium trenchii]|uniref:C3H1-type domain-containing protein n=1 Tax=Durusdinium trenchii TaxID=1381693 RepID=A0ABP0I449_9DINO